ncbi:dihydrolipoamide dehydrogenase [Fervidobacterium changbaicum]|uniref:Dihydrolipoyl dehydrogenase n=2 Tax=Fervidobacterium TaxID=2422 RepID=A0AAI8CLH6_FERIS|nr:MULTISPECIES: dihydrolipoyl dehydrogenase [Fervidobacterium]AMW32531.1 dihydrolipoyl dehydrogenase [Fervidobacterium islandicum]QAV32625.1 dihydrolipoyl dehydrogenase [Fervidobacterium changbaicum]SDH35259.1 dihydrolipoamide dehydrogenase [Fervidobacterium changbaicum]
MVFDTVVIGGGPGGYVCAIKLAQYGKKVALIEKENLGGTCTNWGCIPTKALLTATHLLDESKEKASKLGLKISVEGFDLAGIMAHANKSIMMSRKGIEFLMKKNNVTVVKGTAEVVNRKKVRIKESGEELECENLVLAHGSVPTIFPPFSEVEGIWTSNDVFLMKELPSSLLIVGGGVIGVEFATFFSSLGVKVKIVELADHILPYEDDDVADEVKKSFARKGVEIKEKAKVTGVKIVSNGYEVTVVDSEGKEVISVVDKVLVAVGRRPNIPEDVKNLGVEIERGIKTDLRMRTNIEGVYAIGDVRGQIMLAHVAAYEGVVAAKNIAGIEAEMDYSAVPSIIFTNPEVASTGLREKDVDREKVKIFKFPLSANGRARTMLENIGFVKVIADKNDDTVLGMSIVSPVATELIMEGVIAVRNKLRAHQLEESIHPHPTLSETILGALEGITDKPIHL